MGDARDVGLVSLTGAMGSERLMDGGRQSPAQPIVIVMGWILASEK